MNQAVSTAIRRRPWQEIKLPGLGISWSMLSAAERLVMLYIALLPAWWVSGLYRYMPALTLAGVLYVTIRREGRWPFGRPSPAVVALLAFAGYLLLFPALGGTLAPGFILQTVLFYVMPALLLWCVQGSGVKVRFPVAAWALSVSVLQMVLIWLVFHFVLGEPSFTPPRTLLATLNDKPTDYDFHDYGEGSGKANYLYFYSAGDRAFAGLTRYMFFFLTPEIFGLVAGYLVLVALDLKNRLWSLALLGGSLFLLLLSGSRAVLLAMPLVLLLRYAVSLGKERGPALLCILVAALGFTCLAVPPVTNFLVDTTVGTVEAANDFRAGSTRVRMLIYERTLDRIPDELWTGHTEPGEPVFSSFSLGRVGSHSFILGNLLYRSGVLGTALFVLFWSALCWWFFRTRRGRPLSSFGLLLLLVLLSPLMVFGSELVGMLILLAATVYTPSTSSPGGTRRG
ncbi:O-antigen ligase family protein [Gloeobacter violaceus]|uniref:Gll3715 protein n=1 Tax=Gloeobacter violaceus (strain ATCC 29082 / PCC 7421) TaxID=251221 RepID=Q7NF12_GLOVI|nr:O-antigen ligase family protein [Gloeobacter violaceus]BAC91656.1 gll3715 [Gloeobacter violaceus PCC 7421]